MYTLPPDLDRKSKIRHYSFTFFYIPITKREIYVRNTIFPDRDFLSELAMRAGEIMMRFRWLPSETKEDGTPVTIADKSINTFVICQIEKHFPHVSVIAEEGSRMAGSEYYIFCDPIDGTESFCKGRNLSVFSISVVKNGIPLVAVIYNPFTRQLWSAERGKGCFMNGYRVNVSARDKVSKSSFYVMWWKGKEKLSQFSGHLSTLGGSILDEGSVVYPGGLVASGLFEGTIFPGNNSWEAATMHLIVAEAGGRFTDLHGNEITYPCSIDGCFEGVGHIASNGILHDELISLVSLFS